VGWLGAAWCSHSQETLIAGKNYLLGALLKEKESRPLRNPHRKNEMSHSKDLSRKGNLGVDFFGYRRVYEKESFRDVPLRGTIRERQKRGPDGVVVKGAVVERMSLLPKNGSFPWPLRMAE